MSEDTKVQDTEKDTNKTKTTSSSSSKATTAPPKRAATTKKRKKKRVQKPEKKYSFEQWASRRDVPQRHRGGLRAFISNPQKIRTLTEWDKCFETY